jgi:hypothetical protein
MLVIIVVDAGEITTEQMQEITRENQSLSREYFCNESVIVARFQHQSDFFYPMWQTKCNLLVILRVVTTIRCTNMNAAIQEHFAVPEVERFLWKKLTTHLWLQAATPILID